MINIIYNILKVVAGTTKTMLEVITGFFSTLNVLIIYCNQLIVFIKTYQNIFKVLSFLKCFDLFLSFFDTSVKGLSIIIFKFLYSNVVNVFNIFYNYYVLNMVKGFRGLLYKFYVSTGTIKDPITNSMREFLNLKRNLNYDPNFSGKYHNGFFEISPDAYFYSKFIIGHTFENSYDTNVATADILVFLLLSLVSICLVGSIFKFGYYEIIINNSVGLYEKLKGLLFDFYNWLVPSRPPGGG